MMNEDKMSLKNVNTGIKAKAETKKKKELATAGNLSAVQHPTSSCFPKENYQEHGIGNKPLGAKRKEKQNSKLATQSFVYAKLLQMQKKTLLIGATSNNYQVLPKSSRSNVILK